MYCTLFRHEKQIVYRGLAIILLIGLLLQVCGRLPTADRWYAADGMFDSSGWHWVGGRRRWYHRGGCIHWVVQRGIVVLCRMGLMAGLLVWSGWAQRWPVSWAIMSLPIVDGVVGMLPVFWPGTQEKLAYHCLVWGAHNLYRLAVVVLLCEGIGRGTGGWYGSVALVSDQVRKADGAWARGEIEADGSWCLEMEGHFIFKYKPRSAFEERLVLIFFRQFRTPHSTPKRPFLRQEWLAEWYDTLQEWLSRWQRYVHEGGLEKLNGEHDAWVVTPDIRQAVLAIWVPNFWLSAAEVRQRLLAGGHITSLEDISEASLHRLIETTGFGQVRRLLRDLFTFSAQGPQWREGVLVERLFELNEQLITLLKAQGALTPQVNLEVEALKQALGRPITALEKPLPFAYRLQQVLFGQWEKIEAGSVCCPHCGSTQVRRKGQQAEHKKYYDPTTDTWRQVEGQRFFCLNPACPYTTFTDYPDGLRLYSDWSADTIVWSVLVYMRMRTSYRLAAEAVGVSSATLWRWAMLLGQSSLPVASLFGMVRCSGVIGVDEKWVLVPKNDKPAGKRQRWMYVYLAVDVFTYDLLQIDIYPYNGKPQARAFLQALKAKGYCPQVIITDMNQDYGEPIQQVFPTAIHHECVFHALQWAQRLIKDVYGDDYPTTHPEAVSFKEHIYSIFKAKSKKTVHQRYCAVMSLQSSYVALLPDAQRIFDFLQRHYPKLVNAIENPLIPLTNNTVELVIRRFDQHYQNMCGFDNIGSARHYLNLFELTYRFTPFTQDNKPVKERTLDIRGKCPLELAGYDVSHMPLAKILRDRLLALPPYVQHEVVQCV